MATIQIELTSSNIWHAVKQLSTSEFESLFDNMIALRTQRLAPTVNEEEALLLETVYQARLDDVEQAQYETFVEKSESEQLTVEEQAVFSQLIEKAESLNVERLGAVAKLAMLRHQSFDMVMQALGLLNQDVIATLKS